MTTWRQMEYEKVLREIREAEDRSKKKKGVNNNRRELKVLAPKYLFYLCITIFIILKVSKTMSNNPDMLTEKELHSITKVFKSLEINAEDGVIKPEVGFDCLAQLTIFYFCLGPSQSNEKPGIKSKRTRSH